MMSADENVFKQPHQPQEVSMLVSAEMAGMLEAALEDVALSVSSFQTERGSEVWRVKLILDGNQRVEFERRYANLKAHFDLPEPTIAPLVMQDWVSLVQKHFKPMRAGRFYIYGSHIETAVPSASIPILLDAGAAFGTGEHETTSGCLRALDALLKLRRFARVLDMGCGSGILAMAAAKCLKGAVLHATDIDPVSVQVAQMNAERNGLKRIRFDCGAGYAAPLVCGEYDLVLANILARPLMRMATDLHAHLAPGGIAVLSGLLQRQEEMVLWAHFQAGLRLHKRVRGGPWSVLVLKK
jgi:ribosomal protein L11 methyltransferase